MLVQIIDGVRTMTTTKADDVFERTRTLGQAIEAAHQVHLRVATSDTLFAKIDKEEARRINRETGGEIHWYGDATGNLFLG
jgi:hypothetical protein